jgi:hypothetical protein
LSFPVAPSKRHDPRLVGGQFQPKLPPSLAEAHVEGLGVILALEDAHEVVGVTKQPRLPPTLRFHSFLEPQVQERGLKVIQTRSVCRLRSERADV